MLVQDHELCTTIENCGDSSRIRKIDLKSLAHKWATFHAIKEEA
jgi:hypothetical protein